MSSTVLTEISVPLGTVRNRFHHDPPRASFIAAMQFRVEGPGERFGVVLTPLAAALAMYAPALRTRATA